MASREFVEWFSFEHVDTIVAGELGFDGYTYRWRVTPRAHGDAVAGQGKGVHIVRRGADGLWKLVWDVWYASPAG